VRVRERANKDYAIPKHKRAMSKPTRTPTSHSRLRHTAGTNAVASGNTPLVFYSLRANVSLAGLLCR